MKQVSSNSSTVNISYIYLKIKSLILIATFSCYAQEEQYCKWMAACKLASKGKTMADASFESEVQSLQKLLSMQKTTNSPEKKIITPNQLDINPEDFVSPRHFKKVKSKQVGASAKSLLFLWHL